MSADAPTGDDSAGVDTPDALAVVRSQARSQTRGLEMSTRLLQASIELNVFTPTNLADVVDRTLAPLHALIESIESTRELLSPELAEKVCGRFRDHAAKYQAAFGRWNNQVMKSSIIDRTLDAIIDPSLSPQRRFARLNHIAEHANGCMSHAPEPQLDALFDGYIYSPGLSAENRLTGLGYAYNEFANVWRHTLPHLHTHPDIDPTLLFELDQRLLKSERPHGIVNVIECLANFKPIDHDARIAVIAPFVESQNRVVHRAALEALRRIKTSVPPQTVSTFGLGGGIIEGA